jgi:hypothetical protein
MRMRLRPERYRKRTYGAEQSPAFSSLLLVDTSRSSPASVCASILSCDYARTCNSPWTVQRMPNRGRCPNRKPKWLSVISGRRRANGLSATVAVVASPNSGSLLACQRPDPDFPWPTVATEANIVTNWTACSGSPCSSPVRTVPLCLSDISPSVVAEQSRIGTVAEGIKRTDGPWIPCTPMLKPLFQEQTMSFHSQASALRGREHKSARMIDDALKTCPIGMIISGPRTTQSTRGRVANVFLETKRNIPTLDIGKS